MRVPLLLLSLLLAGCAGSSDHGEGTLVGALNEGDVALDVALTVIGPQGGVAWEYSAKLQPQGSFERRVTLNQTGPHTLVVGVVAQAEPTTVEFTLDPTPCPNLLHLTVAVTPDAVRETTRECH